MPTGVKATLLLVTTFALGVVVGVLGGGAVAQSRRDMRPPPPFAGGPEGRGGPPGLGSRGGPPGLEGRGGPPPDGRGGPPPSFVDLMMSIIQPRDSAQRMALVAILSAQDQKNRTIVDGARAAMKTSMDSLRARIAPLLTPEQVKRFDEFGQPRR
ncbi:MAG TPA: hypothetical protein VE967_04670 [Gemmatimonadaceae bacterium]|nr:hypothetical protein [Gemmatimonadaceae bacterium]